MKICPLGVELFNEDGQRDRQTDMKKLTVAFRNFANVSKSHRLAHYCVYNRPPLVPTVCQINPVHILLSYLLKIHFHITLSPTLRSVYVSRRIQ